MVASDVLEDQNQNYLVVIVYYSKYFGVIRLISETSRGVIRCLNKIFSRRGLVIHKFLLQRNEGICYAIWTIHRTTISPTYSQGNGFADVDRTVPRKECNLNEGLVKCCNTPTSNFLIRQIKCCSVGKSEAGFLFTF